MDKEVDKDSKKKKEVKDKTFVKNTIDLNPTIDSAINEAKRGVAVFTFGRMNPPTIGHEKLVQEVVKVARQEGGKPLVYLSHTYDSKKNPLPYDTKQRLVKRAFGSMVQKSNAKTIFDVMKELDKKYAKVVLVVGSDRVDEFETLLGKYNGKDYTFDSVQVVSAGERDPDDDGVSGMSASKMRDLAVNNDIEGFKKGLPRKLQGLADWIVTNVRDGLKLAEELEADGLLAEVLDIAQRRKRAIAIRRAKARIKRGRMIAQRKMATKDKLKVRARRDAIKAIRKRVAGKKGQNYANLSPGEKSQVDRLVAKRKSTIGKLAQRLLPKVTARERQRLKSYMASKNKTNEEFNEVLNILAEAYWRVDIEGLPAVFMDGPSSSTIKNDLRRLVKKPNEQIKSIERVQRADIIKAFRLQAQGKESEVGTIGVEEDINERFHMLMNKNGTVKHDKRFRFNKKKEITEEELFRHIDAMFEEYEELETLYKIEKDLTEKAQKANIPVEEIVREFVEEDNIKEAYQRVNSFISFSEGNKKGLWDNIHDKRKRIKDGSGEKMRAPGSKGAPTDADFKAASEDVNSVFEAYFEVGIEGLPKIYMDAKSSGEVKQQLRRLLKKPNEQIQSIDRVQRSDMMKSFRDRAAGKEVEDDEEDDNLDEAFLYDVSWGTVSAQVSAKDASDAISKAKAKIMQKTPKLSNPKYRDTFLKRPSVNKITGREPRAEGVELGEARINSREYASNGLMHPNDAKMDIHRVSGRYVDFYADKTGDDNKGHTIEIREGNENLGAAQEKIKREKEADKKKHDRMLDIARSQDTKAANATEATHGPEGMGKSFKDFGAELSKKKVRMTKHVAQDKKAAMEQHDKCGTPECCGQCDTANLDAAFENFTLQLDRGKNQDALKITETGKKGWTEVRGKKNYEGKGYDSKDKLHKTLDKIGKAANMSELMNGSKVSVNPKHPDARKAIAELERLVREEHGAGDEGTNKLVKKYKKDTPGETVKEAISFMEERNLDFCENIYRPMSEAYFEFFREARRMYESGEINVEGVNKQLLETDIGEFVRYEGKVVPLDCPLVEEDEKQPELNKPHRGGTKKFYVYVKDPSTGNIKKVSWGDTTGLKAKINNPEARKSFAARHQCDTRNDKTTASYWACRLPRYAKALGMQVDNPGSWW